jgi:glycosyltransferase involved in cell wall biosynthesis
MPNVFSIFKKKSDTLPLVSISCLVYNHAAFLDDAFKGFLKQKTNFKFEVIIHDDASNDGSREIIDSYTKKYPDIFFPFIQRTNQYSQGIRGISERYNFPRCRGKYIAMCEGDDYWRDENKLQTQVDFLERHAEYSMSCHQALVIDNSNLRDSLFNSIKKDTEITFDELLFKNTIPTASIVFRNTSIHLPTHIETGDWILCLYLARQGKIHFSTSVMSVYRKHPNSVWSSLPLKEMIYKGITVMNQINEYYNFEFDQKIQLAIQERLKMLK